jgi:hypothetical protein
MKVLPNAFGIADVYSRSGYARVGYSIISENIMMSYKS